MLTGCDGCVEPILSENVPEPVKVSIDSRFVTYFSSSIIDDGTKTVQDSRVCRLEQFGSGTDAELGAFDVYLTCCWNPGDGSHSCTEGFITDFKGNTLNILCRDGDNGVLFTPDFPYDQTNICAEFEFTGGTGRFDGASGSGSIECDVKGDYNMMIHYWKADLILLNE
jgi:hypothetical protein